MDKMPYEINSLNRNRFLPNGSGDPGVSLSVLSCVANAGHRATQGIARARFHSRSDALVTRSLK